MNVVVLGMHRSGTSAVTRLVTLAGVPTAADPEVARGGPANERGFWEVRPLTALNERVLWQLGGTWATPPPLPEGWIEDPRLHGLPARAERLVRTLLPTPSFVWKDPRLCLTLPFWLDTIGRSPAVVLVVRHPIEVARSLERRDDMPLPVGLALWERYLRDAVRHASSLPVAVVDYERLLAEPAAWTAGLHDWLRGIGVACGSPADAATIEAFIDPSLQHARAASRLGASDTAVSPEQRALFERLLAAEGMHGCLDLDPLPPVTPTAEALLESRRTARMQREPRRGRRARRTALRRLSSLRRRFR